MSPFHEIHNNSLKAFKYILVFESSIPGVPGLEPDGSWRRRDDPDYTSGNPSSYPLKALV